MFFKLLDGGRYSVEKAQLKLVNEYLLCKKAKMKPKKIAEILDPLKQEYKALLKHEEEHAFMLGLTNARWLGKEMNR